MSVTFPIGFLASGVNCGLKESDKDVALVVNTGPNFDATGVFTPNQVKAAPVLWSTEVLKTSKIKAILLNSGGANACTGSKGFQNTHKSAELTAKLLNFGAADVAVCSTGLIGKHLDMKKISNGIDLLVKSLNKDGGNQAAEAILTTDSHKKVVALDKDKFKLGAMIKGAGMLAPDLATMLCVITTDADISQLKFKDILNEVVKTTLNRLDSDGCTSTNDSVFLMSSGASKYSPSSDEFKNALIEVLDELSNLLINDAEGSTKNIEITIRNAMTEDDATEVGKSIARNNLLKCAFFGEDPNWGRILAAIGNSKAKIDADKIDVAINDVLVCKSGMSCENESKIDLSNRLIKVDVDLNIGTDKATVLTNDLSIKYVHENSAYSS
ncbi:MAG: bifunctional glutamate N-acetyltransferase/amino-acid acetyltransferase ArgJ [Actinomycetes bacterium]